MKRALLGLAGALALVCASSAQALDYWDGPPGWERYGAGTTYAHYDFEGADLGDVISVDDYYNPYGTPSASPPDTSTLVFGDYEVSTDLSSTGVVSGLEFLAEGTFRFPISNSPEANPIKKIFIQVTSSKGPIDMFVDYVGGPAGSYEFGTFDTGRAQIQYENGWYTYNYGLTISPNPAFEMLALTMPQGAILDQVVIDTICMPEPASLLMLSLAGLLIRRR